MNGSALRGLLSVLCENVKDVTHRGEAPCTVHREQKKPSKEAQRFYIPAAPPLLHYSLFFILYSLISQPLKLYESFSSTERLNTRCSGVESTLSTQK